MSKAELIREFKAGNKEMVAIDCMTGFHVVEIIHGIEDKVFGYFTKNYGQEVDTFHLVKINQEGERNSFKVRGMTCYLDNCITQ